MIKTVAFVIPWFGDACKGGAENYCAGLAQAVAQCGFRVEVITTCCSSAWTEWSTNDLPAGTLQYGDVTVRRFPVRKRNAEIFVNGWRTMDAGLTLSPDEQRDMIRHSITSEEMLAFLDAHKDDYVFCFIPYLYGTTVEGMQALPPRTGILIPCLHDEPIARMDVFGEVFNAAREVLFLSVAEMDVCRRLYGLPDEKLHLLGGGLSAECVAPSAELFRTHFPQVTKPYLLCVGRKVPGKGADIVLDYFAQMMRNGQLPAELDLVLIGEGALEIPDDVKMRVHSLRCEGSPEVYSAMAGAQMLIQPSLMESFSIVLMEAWLNRRPALVNGNCAVTRHHVTVSGGGLWFEDYPTFVEAVTLMLDSPSMRLNMALNGERYVRENWLWEHVSRRFEHIMHTFLSVIPQQ